jgi:signal transduction histidine kinase
MANLSEEINIILISSAFFLLVAVGMVFLVLVYQKRQSQYLREKAALKAAYERELLEAQLDIQELTLKNVAQEIHDNIGQTLTLVKLNLNTISRSKDLPVQEKLLTTKELVAKAIADLRTISKTLHSEAVLAGGLTEAVNMELRLIERAGAFQTVFAIHGTPVNIDPQRELILFRAVQEGLNNAIKHSGASCLEVHLHYTETELRVIVKDNGHGFLLSSEDAEKGSGLRNMRNRAKLIGGSFQINGELSGTQIQLNLPIIAA